MLNARRLGDGSVAFETPARVDGAPDYTAAAMARKLEGLKAFKDIGQLFAK